MNHKGNVQFGDTTITYVVVRSQRRKKTIQTQVSLENVRVLAPADTSDREVEQLIRKQARWILDRREVLKNRPAPKQFISGETMPYLGVEVQITVNTDQFSRPSVRFDNGRFLFDAPPGFSTEERRELIRNAFIEWYRERAAEYLPERVEYWLPFVACNTEPRILIRDQRRRWASCARDGTLRFNWQAMMLDPELIDYLMVHELTHLIAMNHSSHFWDLVSFVIPDVKDRRQRLRQAERRLPLW